MSRIPYRTLTDNRIRNQIHLAIEHMTKEDILETNVDIGSIPTPIRQLLKDAVESRLEAEREDDYERRREEQGQ